MRILFVLGYPRTTRYLLPAFEALAASDDVAWFRYRQMSSKDEVKNPEVDLRPHVHARLEATGARLLGEPPEPHAKDRDNYSAAFVDALDRARADGWSPDLAVFDESLGKTHWGSAVLYRMLRARGVPVVGCQEGATDDDEHGLRRMARGLGVHYDYALCFGRWDEARLLAANPALEGRLRAVGIPAHDELEPYAGLPPDGKEHILLVPSYTRLSGPSSIFEPLTDEIIEAAGVWELAERTGLPVVIKEKGKPFTTERAFAHLEERDDVEVRVTVDESELNELVGRARYVVGAPSTLLLAPIQLGIPTAILGEPFMGRRGVLAGFPGLTDSSRNRVLATLEAQDEAGGVGEGFVEDAVRGGSDFSSTRRFVEAVRGLEGRAESYEGPLMLGGLPLRERVERRFPRAFKRLQGAAAALRGWMGGG